MELFRQRVSCRWRGGHSYSVPDLFSDLDKQALYVLLFAGSQVEVGSRREGLGGIEESSAMKLVVDDGER
jgi:hypothetical protein